MSRPRRSAGLEILAHLLVHGVGAGVNHVIDEEEGETIAECQRWYPAEWEHAEIRMDLQGSAHVDVTLRPVVLPGLVSNVRIAGNFVIDDE